MKRTSLFVLSVLSAAIFAPQGLAQTLNVTDGTNSFGFTADQTGGDSQTLGGAGDILFEEGWFLVIDGVSTRLENTDPNNIAITGNDTFSGTVSYSNVPAATAALFDVDLNYQIDTVSSGVVDLDIEVALTLDASTAGPVTGSLINYFDYDINGAAGQTAVFTDSPVPTIAQINPTTGNSFSRTGIGANAFDVDSFSTLRTNLEAGLLLDSNPDLGSIDVTSAFQWDFTLAPGESLTIGAGGVGVVSVGSIPEPSTLAMIGFLGIAMCLKRSRNGS